MHDVIVEIIESISRNKLRTCLTGFAVSWGIFMLIVLLGAGNGIMNTTRANTEGLLSNTMEIYGGYTSKPYDGLGEGRSIDLKNRDVQLTSSELFSDVVDEVTEMVSQSGLVMNSGKSHFSIQLTGVYPVYAPNNKVDLYAGRFIDDNDIKESRKVAVINHMQARNFLSGSHEYEKMIGRKVKINGILFTVVGVRQAYENEDDSEVYCPYTTMKVLFSKGDTIDEIAFSFHGLPTEEANDAFEDQYRAVINRSHRAAPDDRSAIWISNRFKMNMQMEKGTGILETFIWIIGLLTLISGIVGVSNIMLITVKERTHEFGIRKAIGASPWDVMKLIVAESVTITAFFGYIGMLLGMVACEILNATVGSSSIELFGSSIQIMQNPSVGFDVAIEATVLLVVAGTLAGLFPARRASRVKPIEALRGTR